MAIALAQTSRANLGLRLNHGAVVASPSWKLYHNPHYFSPRGDSSGPSRRSPSRPEHRRPMIVANFDEDDGGGGMERQLGYGDGGATSVPELLARVEELAAELEFERRMRRKVEALNEALAAELAEERRRVEAERARMREELDEERRMLRVAELWREERVRMKLADARAAVEEKLREVADAGQRAADATAAAEGCSCRSGSPIGGKASPASVGQQSPASSRHGQQSPASGQHSQSHRREVTGGENPHIRRGIKGSVEFPRAVRVRPRGEERVDLVSNIECQRAQLRVLMRHRSPATAGMPGLVGAAPDNLVV
ncbi:protein BRANCHLESS TRICHOME [Triticum urartu]|uniref:Uncharacterized protein n=1 Tax=Triticum turgidum subsp. durum TaxID=4567 RepID=A0A9R0QBQ0_TRITD|nr:protein BRANCHLESS TRICHOME-like [Triticum dicoccoides]XP_048553481.1 protein BRANCHLESS TRICHOME [Triticum urartu]VAH06334.1 unnamed protein product [Triticum turgidum subsp. durum]